MAKMLKGCVEIMESKELIPKLKDYRELLEYARKKLCR